MPAILDPVLSNDLIAQVLQAHGGRPDWARHLPEDPSTIHTGGNPRAEEFQARFSDLTSLGSWCASHVCIMQLMSLSAARLPRRYLEIGVCEGWSVYALITALRLEKSLARQDVLAPLFDELVLADSWGPHFGGSERGSHAHVANLLRSVGVDPDQVTFLDGDSKVTVPAYLRQRRHPVPFDVVYVDGDHSYEGSKADLTNVLPYVGNMLFFDDIYHAVHCLNDRLLDLHRSLVVRLKHDFYVFTNRSYFGFAAFVRKSYFDALP